MFLSVRNITRAVENSRVTARHVSVAAYFKVCPPNAARDNNAFDALILENYRSSSNLYVISIVLTLVQPLFRNSHLPRLAWSILRSMSVIASLPCHHVPRPEAYLIRQIVFFSRIFFRGVFLRAIFFQKICLWRIFFRRICLW